MPRYFLAAQVAGVCPTTEDFLAKVERNDDYRSKVFVRPSDLPAIQQWLEPARLCFDHKSCRWAIPTTAASCGARSQTVPCSSSMNSLRRPGRRGSTAGRRRSTP